MFNPKVAIVLTLIKCTVENNEEKKAYKQNKLHMEIYEKTYSCGERLYVPSPITYIYAYI